MKKQLQPFSRRTLAPTKSLSMSNVNTDFWQLRHNEVCCNKLGNNKLSYSKLGNNEVGFKI